VNNIKIAVAMSGGVDSSVCAYLLKKQGHEVIGITMEVLNIKKYKQDTERVSQDASCVAKKLGIPHYTVDLQISLIKK
jgi:tRNA-specific 2-thiouridylase